MLFIDYSSAFNTIVLSKLIIKLKALGLNPALCNWVLDFLTCSPQVVKDRKQHLHFADSQHWGPTRVRAQPPTVLLTHYCMAMHSSNSIIKFADDTTVVGLITPNDETAYREAVVTAKQPLTQRQQNKGDDRGLQETAEGAPPYPHRRDNSGEDGKF